MNNVTLGGRDGAGAAWAFYETNACGMGARPAADGIDAIHAHMTNTLNTPIETIERTSPLLVTRYEFSDRSAGAGKFRGGCGLVRGFALRAGMATMSLLAERHVVRPRGFDGGGDGGCGSHAFVGRSGEVRDLPAKTIVALQPGDEVVIRTAGGGGYGPVAERSPAASARDEADGIEPAAAASHASMRL
jgi:N-methylhydantoinase B